LPQLAPALNEVLYVLFLESPSVPQEHCAGYFIHPFRKNGICAGISRRSNPLMLAPESSPEKMRRSDLFKTLLLCCFFVEESQTIQRLSLRNVKLSFQ
jgi:hypothetical protein